MYKIWSSILPISNSTRCGGVSGKVLNTPESISSRFSKGFSSSKDQIKPAEIVGEDAKKPKRTGKFKITPITIPSTVEHYRMPESKRTDSYFPSLTTIITKQGVVNKDGYKQITFKFPPKMGKRDISAYLSQIYGLKVLKVHTINYEGKKKRVTRGISKLPDWKKSLCLC